jgi:hypothetical protein
VMSTFDTVLDDKWKKFIKHWYLSCYYNISLKLFTFLWMRSRTFMLNVLWTSLWRVHHEMHLLHSRTAGHILIKFKTEICQDISTFFKSVNINTHCMKPYMCLCVYLKSTSNTTHEIFIWGKMSEMKVAENNETDVLYPGYFSISSTVFKTIK